MKIRVLLVDDHQMFREGLRSLLEREADIEVVGQAGDGRSAIDMCAELEPDVVLMDVGMKELNGIESARRIIKQHRETKVVALSAYADSHFVKEMLEIGARGYVLKESATDDVIKAIRAAMQGRKYVSANLAETMIDGIMGWLPVSQKPAGAELSDREREIVQLLAEGKSSKQIAGNLHISARTVETHRRNIMKKLDLHNVAALTKYAIRKGLSSPEPN